MPKTTRLVLPARWKRFVGIYANDHAYWYQPKGLAVTVDAVEERLAPLAEFEGTRPWRECQADYVKQLNKLQISEAHGPALGRMLKQVLGTLGLAWVDPGDLVEITPVGRRFLASTDKAAVLAGQSRRYQFWNPSIGGSVHRSIELHPVPFLLRLLQTLTDGLSPTESMRFSSLRRSALATSIKSSIKLMRFAILRLTFKLKLFASVTHSRSEVLSEALSSTQLG